MSTVTENSKRPNFPPKALSRSILTVTANRSSTSQESRPSLNTQKLDLEEIKLPNNARQNRLNDEYPPQLDMGVVLRGSQDLVRYLPDFSFEKRRLKELGVDRLSKYVVDGPITEIDKQDPRAIRLSIQNEAVLATEANSIMKWAAAMRVLSIVFILWSILSAIFSMVFTFVMALNGQVSVLSNTIPMVFNVVSAVWMIYICIRGGTVSGVTTPEAEALLRHIKFCLGSLIAVCLQFMVMPICRPISRCVSDFPGLTAGTSTDAAAAQRAQAFVSLGYMVVWMIALVNAVGYTLCAAFAMLLRKYMRLRDMHALEQRTLPLGYQVYAKLSPSERGISSPYNL
ncbi:MAG: hypothetical protein P4M11_11920 [Candidatus Pacebacteria bacterium]|nr:hypothetical protein [Candidatus Paceibacterota bacterium]